MSVSTPNSPLRTKKKKQRQSIDDKMPKPITRMNTKRFYSAAPAINIGNINTIKKSSYNHTSPSTESPLPGHHLTRRCSMKQTHERKRKTDGAFDFWNADEETKTDKMTSHKKRKRARKAKHTRSVSLRGLKSSLSSLSSPRSRASSRAKKKANGFAFNGRRRAGSKWSNDSEGSADSVDDLNKVWTLKDLIGEMVSNHSDHDHRMRNALVLCHSTFTSSVELFE
eukprot:116468_1